MEPGKKSAEERKEQIITAAIRRFHQKGYHKTTMDDIVEESGLSKGALYWHFESKEALIASVLNYFTKKFSTMIQPYFSDNRSASRSLEIVIKKTSQFFIDHQGFLNLLIEYWSASPERERITRFWTDMMTPFKDNLLCLIRRGISAGEFSPCREESLAWFITAALEGIGLYTMVIEGFQIEQVIQAFNTLLEKGLGEETRSNSREEKNED